MVEIACRLEFLDQTLEGQVLMVVGRLGTGLYLVEHIQKGWRMTTYAAEVRTQGKVVDKETDERFKLRIIAVSNR